MAAVVCQSILLYAALEGGIWEYFNRKSIQSWFVTFRDMSRNLLWTILFRSNGPRLLHAIDTTKFGQSSQATNNVLTIHEKVVLQIWIATEWTMKSFHVQIVMPNSFFERTSTEELKARIIQVPSGFLDFCFWTVLCRASKRLLLKIPSRRACVENKTRSEAKNLFIHFNIMKRPFLPSHF